MGAFPRSMFLAGATKVSRSAYGAGGRGTPVIPIMEALVELPELMVSPKGRIARVINRATKDSMVEEMHFHHKVRIPDHFSRFRQKKYNYAQRSTRTQKIKQMRQQADLVKVGRTKDRMLADISIRFPRTGQPGVSILGVLKWPIGFRVHTGAARGVTAAVMADEISRWTSQEEKVASRHILENFVERLNVKLSKPAKRSIRSQLAPLGIT